MCETTFISLKKRYILSIYGFGVYNVALQFFKHMHKYEFNNDYEVNYFLSLHNPSFSYLENYERFSCFFHSIYWKYAIFIKKFVALQRCRLQIYLNFSVNIIQCFYCTIFHSIITCFGSKNFAN